MIFVKYWKLNISFSDVKWYILVDNKGLTRIKNVFFKTILNNTSCDGKVGPAVLSWVAGWWRQINKLTESK